MSPRLEVDLPRDQYAPGDPVEGTVTVAEGGKSRNLEVFINCCDRTQDYRGVSFQQGSGHLHEGDLEAGQSFQFSLRVPEDAVPQFASPNGVMYWEIDAKSDEFGMDTHERRVIIIVTEPPGGG